MNKISLFAFFLIFSSKFIGINGDKTETETFANGLSQSILNGLNSKDPAVQQKTQEEIMAIQLFGIELIKMIAESKNNPAMKDLIGNLPKIKRAAQKDKNTEEFDYAHVDPSNYNNDKDPFENPGVYQRQASQYFNNEQKCADDYHRAMADMHNKFRPVHAVPELESLNRLKLSALNHARRISQSGTMNASGPSNTGVNLAMMGGNVNFQNCYNIGLNNFELWFKGKDKYDYKNGSFSMDTGSFTQVVWKQTHYIGCGVSIENNQAFGVCHYQPPGNVMSQFQENVLPPMNNVDLVI